MSTDIQQAAEALIDQMSHVEQVGMIEYLFDKVEDKYQMLSYDGCVTRPYRKDPTAFIVAPGDLIIQRK